MGANQAVDAFWANADVSKKVNKSLDAYLPEGTFRVTLSAIKSLINTGEKGRTGKVFGVTILESDNDSVKPGESYQIAYWMHLYGADKIRKMLKDSMDLSDEELSDKDTLGTMTDDDDSPLLGLTTTIKTFATVSKKSGQEFLNYSWGMFEEMAQ